MEIENTHTGRQTSRGFKTGRGKALVAERIRGAAIQEERWTRAEKIQVQAGDWEKCNTESGAFVFNVGFGRWIRFSGHKALPALCYVPRDDDDLIHRRTGKHAMNIFIRICWRVPICKGVGELWCNVSSVCSDLRVPRFLRVVCLSYAEKVETSFSFVDEFTYHFRSELKMNKSLS